MHKEQIIHYYDTCEEDYRLFWDLDQSHAMHAGYWDETTRSLREALKRENEILAQRAGIKKEDRVLDAGCGVGGSSLFLAKTFGCQVVGISLSGKQVETAQRKAKETGLGSLVQFEVRDYTQTAFADQSFDVIWAIESVCHAQNKRLFAKEAFRLLKSGGCLILADGFASQSVYTGKDQQRMQRWLNGWGVSQLDTVFQFKDSLAQEGFACIDFQDITNHVLPSSKRLYWYSWPAIALSKIGEAVGLRKANQTENLYGARCQYQTLKKKLWTYGLFYAKKL